jgi:hypothetical protein
MNHKTTVLRALLHREFLDAKRQDPVTRKVFVARDRITLCATCLLPFLEESWCAIGGTHCGQSAGIGLEILETPVKTPAQPDGDSSGGDSNDDGVAASSAAATSADPRLRSIPVKLSEIPIGLR